MSRIARHVSVLATIALVIAMVMPGFAVTGALLPSPKTQVVELRPWLSRRLHPFPLGS